MRTRTTPALLSQFGQVFQNPMMNAVKYRQPGLRPCIHVAARQTAGEWTISVADNGIGIAPEYHERIFGLFKRLHNNEIPGTGIGLAICKKIIERHDGRVWVEPAPGVGSTFYFTVPDGTAEIAKPSRDRQGAVMGSAPPALT